MSNKIMKLCACYATVTGRYSGFIETRGASGTGKSYEDEIVLSCFPDEDVVRLNDITYASLCDMHDELNEKIIFLGDLGNAHFSRLEKVFDVFKILTTEGVYTRRMVRQDDKVLCASSICVVYESVRRFVRDEQIRSRTACFSAEYTDSDLLRLYVQKEQAGSDEDKSFVREYREKISQKRQIDVDVEHNFVGLFADEVDRVHCENKVRKLGQLLVLFEAFVVLDTDIDCSCTVTATAEQYTRFIELVRECSFLSDPVESEFVGLLRGVVEPVDVDALVYSEFGEYLEDMCEEDVNLILVRKFAFNTRSKLADVEGKRYFFNLNELRTLRQCAAYNNVKNDVEDVLAGLVRRGVVGELGSVNKKMYYFLHLK